MSEEMKEGTAFFTIRALLPVVESFGFADGSCAAPSSTSSLYSQFFNQTQKFEHEPREPRVPNSSFTGELIPSLSH